jgi:hypothetical protein
MVTSAAQERSFCRQVEWLRLQFLLHGRVDRPR